MSSNSPASTPTNQSAGEEGATVGIGGRTSGQRGATPSHESHTETGGNGGPGLTRNQSGPYVNAPDGTDEGGPVVTQGSEAPTPQAPHPDAAPDSAATHVNPGKTDTRPDQAGIKPTGLGAPETGANQSPADVPPFTR